MSNLPLFDEPPSFDRAGLARKLNELAREQIYLGGSSWKYQGWLGQIYTPERYFTRGRFSQKRFEEQCLSEYAETFPVVCGDFSFYQFPGDDFWKKLFDTAPPPLKFAFKAPEEITIKTFPTHPRYGPRAGEENPAFLNATLFAAGFLEPLLPYKDRIAVLILEFGTFSKKAYETAEEFCRDLDAFLFQLPRDFRYSVEIRNEEFLVPVYFDTLRKHDVAHVFNAWSRMPPIHKQLQIAGAHTASFTVARALLRVGRPYEKAVEAFAPYDRIQDENPQTRESIRELITHARKKRQPAYLFINNRLEGNTPQTIQAIVQDDE